MTQDVIQVPFEGVAVRKLHDLFERGYTVCGVAIQRPSLVADADRGAITTHGMVMWWPPEQHKIEQVPAPKNLYEITGNVAHVNTVLIERAELHRLQAENAGVQALIAVHQRTLERCLDLKAECAELEAMLDAVGAGGVGESIRSAAQPEVRIRTSVPDGWKLVPVEPTDDMFIEGMEADCRGRPSIDDDNHVRSIWRAMLSSAPDAPLHPAQQDPVGAQFRFNDGQTVSDWKPCDIEHHDRVQSDRKLFSKIESRLIYAAPKPPVQPDTAPAAWAILSDDGTAIRLWSKDKATAQEAADKHGRPLVPLYTAPQPTENLRCKSTQKRLATLWGYVKQDLARQPLPADTYTALAHRIATRFTYSTDRSFCEYYFAIHTLEQFVRAIEQAHGITGGQ